jgi:hypothetical protein
MMSGGFPRFKGGSFRSNRKADETAMADEQSQWTTTTAKRVRDQLNGVGTRIFPP